VGESLRNQCHQPGNTLVLAVFVVQEQMTEVNQVQNTLLVFRFELLQIKPIDASAA